MIKPKGLGRGLDALLGGDTPAPRDALATLPVGRIRPGKYQPRTKMDQQALAELAASIRSQGLMQPLLVRPVDRDRYELIAGERRWRAAQMAGLEEVPVLVREVADEAALALSLIENIQRENLNPMEEAAGVQRLIDEFASEWDPDKYTDDYRENIKKVIAAKQKKAEPELELEADPQSARVVDLMERLRQSLGTKRAETAKARTGPSARKGAGRKKAARRPKRRAA